MIIKQPQQCARGHCMHRAGWVGVEQDYYAVLHRCCWCDLQVLMTTEIRLSHGPMLKAREEQPIE